MKSIYKLVPFLIISFQFVNVFSQNVEAVYKQKIILHFDSVYGVDNLLINGKIFMYPNYNAKGDPFFYGESIKECDVFIKNKKFSNLPGLYNITEDQLIVNSIINNNKISVELNKHLIDSFYISHIVGRKNTELRYNTKHSIDQDRANSNFVISKTFINIPGVGFFEEIFNGRDQLLKKYFKTFSDKVSQENPHGSYTGQKTKLYIYRDFNIIDIGTKSKLIKVYSYHKKEIKRFIRDNKFKFNVAKNEDLIKLMNFCENLTNR